MRFERRVVRGCEEDTSFFVRAAEGGRYGPVLGIVRRGGVGAQRGVASGPSWTAKVNGVWGRERYASIDAAAEAVARASAAR